MMDGNKLDELRELVEFLKANEIAEFDMDRDDLKVKIKFAGPAAPAGGLAMAQLSRMMASAAGPAVAAPAASVAAAAAPEAAEVMPDAATPATVGTFFASPSPGAPTVVQVGDAVEVGQ